jgi:hypothetical protein
LRSYWSEEREPPLHPLPLRELLLILLEHPSSFRPVPVELLRLAKERHSLLGVLLPVPQGRRSLRGKGVRFQEAEELLLLLLK